MEEKNNKFKQNLIKSIITMVVLSFIIGASYAFFSSSVSTSSKDITLGKIGLVFNDGTEWLNTTGMLPISEYEIADSAVKKSFSISNSGNITEYVDINLSNLSVSSNLRSFDVKWALYEGDTKLTTGSFLNGNSDINIISNILLAPDQVNNYNLYIWLNETGENQYFMSEPADGEITDPSISLKIVANAMHKKINTLASKYNFTTAKTNPNFTISSTDNGIFKSADDSSKTEFGFPVYYFRGNVNNNYVSFGGLTWRIIRFNEDGSIKIIAENKPNALINLTVNDNNYQTSSLATQLNNWYSSTIASSIQSKVSNSMFCNDITDSTTERLVTNISPTFICDYGKNKVVSNVSTISADEILYAGGLVTDEVANTTYLNNGEQFFTLTGSNNTDLYAWGIDNSSLKSVTNSNAYGIRPVINLKSNVIVSSGYGTSNNPYVIN